MTRLLLGRLKGMFFCFCFFAKVNVFEKFTFICSYSTLRFLPCLMELEIDVNFS